MTQSGEKEYLKRLGRLLHGPKLDWRDDCVIRSIDAERNLLYSIDRPEQIYSSGDTKFDIRRFGRWAAGLVANDVIACGGKPEGIAFDIGVKEFSADSFEEWVAGVQDVCQQYSMNYEGGNLAPGTGVTGMSWGIAEKRSTIRRAGATEGAVLLATAELGVGWLARLWRSEGRAERELGIISQYQDNPWINLHAFQDVWDLGVILCGMDLTDGVIEFGYEVFEQSGLGVVFDPQVESDSLVDTLYNQLGIPRKVGIFEPGYDTPFAHGWCIAARDVGRVRQALSRHGVKSMVLGSATNGVDGVFVRTGPDQVTRLPRYWDDVMVHRGSVERWRQEILPIFQN